MEEEVLVLEVKDKKVKVKIERNKSCQGCGLCSLNPGGMMVTEVEDPIGVKVGDRVRVEIPDKDFLKAGIKKVFIPGLAKFSEKDFYHLPYTASTFLTPGTGVLLLCRSDSSSFLSGSQ